MYLRLSTRPIDQPTREATEVFEESIISGGYWKMPPKPGAELAIVFCGAVAPEADTAYQQLIGDIPDLGLLSITSPDRLHANWLDVKKMRRRQVSGANAEIERLLRDLAPSASLITVIDGHPATLSWLGAVAGHRIYPLGVEQFGQSGDINDLYRHYGIDTDAILDAAARACLRQGLASSYLNL